MQSICVGKVSAKSTSGVSAELKGEHLHVPVFEVNRRPIVKVEVGVGENGLPVAYAMQVAAVDEHLSFFLCPFLSHLLVSGERKPRVIPELGYFFYNSW